MKVKEIHKFGGLYFIANNKSFRKCSTFHIKDFVSYNLFQKHILINQRN